MKFDVFEYTNKGGRSYNEDSVGSKYDETKGIFIVADGLGGHSFGELASACAAETFLSEWNGFSQNPEEQMQTLTETANRNILAIQKEKNTVLKSTAAVLAVDSEKAVFANTGDSRVYYFHKSCLHTVTADHSVAYKKYKAGEITRDMIGTDEDQSRLLRTLGGEDRYQPDIYIIPCPLEAGDAFLLCSDGAWEYLRDEEILVDLLKAENAQQWAELLLLRIIDRVNGENDNLTVLTVRIEG